ncbi:MAG: regulatory protein RecX [Candidatus Berkelbacteria bacterium]|nr:regulatory protein RecX [Candidatus Berkelbacteria bacterium]
MKKLNVREYAFWLLKSRDRSIGEMEEKLKRKMFGEKEIAETLAFLIEKKFLDDQKFTENYVRFQKSIKPTGKYWLKNKLMAKKVPAEIVEKVLAENSDQTDEIAEAADRFIAKNAKIPPEKIYEKLSRHLLSRGFDWEKVREVVGEKL